VLAFNHLFEEVGESEESNEVSRIASSATRYPDLQGYFDMKVDDAISDGVDSTSPGVIISNYGNETI
jgi:hypothetical protein